MPAPVLTAALYSRFGSRGLDDVRRQGALGDAQAVRRPRREARLVTAELEVLPDPDAVAQRGAAVRRRAGAGRGRRAAAASPSRSAAGTRRGRCSRSSSTRTCPGRRRRSTRSTSASRRPAIPTATSRTSRRALPPQGERRGARDAGRGGRPRGRGGELRAVAARALRPRSTSGSARTATRPRSSRATRCSTSPTATSRSPAIYMGRRRMTLTYPTLERARSRCSGWSPARTRSTRSRGCAPATSRFPPAASRRAAQLIVADAATQG